MAQEQPSEPAVSQHVRECSQDPDLDCSQRLCADRDPEEAAGTARRPVHHPARSGSHPVHASSSAAIACRAARVDERVSWHEPAVPLCDLIRDRAAMQVPGLLCEDADLSSRVRYPLWALFPVPALARMAANRPGILHFRSGLSGEGDPLSP